MRNGTEVDVLPDRGPKEMETYLCDFRLRLYNISNQLINGAGIINITMTKIMGLGSFSILQHRGLGRSENKMFLKKMEL